MIVITVNGRQFAVDEDGLLHFLKSNGKEIVTNNEHHSNENNNKIPKNLELLQE